MGFYERIEKLMEDQNVSPYKVSKDTGIGQSTFTRWKQSSILPDGQNLLRLAKYFNVSTDYLLGLEDSNLEDDGFDVLAASSGVPINQLTDDQREQVTNLAKYFLEKNKGKK